MAGISTFRFSSLLSSRAKKCCQSELRPSSVSMIFIVFAVTGTVTSGRGGKFLYKICVLTQILCGIGPIFGSPGRTSLSFLLVRSSNLLAAGIILSGVGILWLIELELCVHSLGAVIRLVVGY